jgi:hypothetical protein
VPRSNGPARTDIYHRCTVEQYRQLEHEARRLDVSQSNYVGTCVAMGLEITGDYDDPAAARESIGIQLRDRRGRKHRRRIPCPECEGRPAPLGFVCGLCLGAGEVMV